MPGFQEAPLVPAEERSFDENGHVNTNLSTEAKFAALYDAARHGEALRVLADHVFGTNFSGLVNPAKADETAKGGN